MPAMASLSSSPSGYNLFLFYNCHSCHCPTQPHPYHLLVLPFLRSWSRPWSSSCSHNLSLSVQPPLSLPLTFTLDLYNPCPCTLLSFRLSLLPPVLSSLLLSPIHPPHFLPCTATHALIAATLLCHDFFFPSPVHRPSSLTPFHSSPRPHLMPGPGCS